MSSLRLVIADDHEVVRKGLCALLLEQPGWEVTEARDGREAIEKAKDLRPDVVVLDISMPGLNGLEAARQIAKSGAKTKVLVLTMHESDTLIREALDAGVRGFLLKTDAGKDLVGAVDALRRNQTFFTPKVAQMLLDGYLKTDSQTTPTESGPQLRLTARQREIVQLLAEGKSSKEIAVELDVSVKTVETHRANIMSRLNCHCVSELVRYAIRNHIVEA
jgi:DNA-binding NarL/FixJ family response regulator